MSINIAWVPANDPLNPIDGQRVRWYSEATNPPTLIATQNAIDPWTFTASYGPTDDGTYYALVDSRHEADYSNPLKIRATIASGALQSVQVTPAGSGGSVPPPTGGEASIMP